MVSPRRLALVVACEPMDQRVSGQQPVPSRTLPPQLGRPRELRGYSFEPEAVEGSMGADAQGNVQITLWLGAGHSVQHSTEQSGSTAA
jgi:hypothetical protein